MEYVEQCVTGPNLPATVLLILILIYGVFVILGALDFALFDFDVDVDADAGAFSSIGFVTLKFLNIGNVPIMIWVTIFGLTWWCVSLALWNLFDMETYEAKWQFAAQLTVRNALVAVVLTKIFTEPLIKVFERHEEHRPEDLIGQSCVIATVEATPDFGQARYQTDGAPLLLNVKTDGEQLAKGDRAMIVDFDPETRVYLITKLSHEVQT